MVNAKSVAPPTPQANSIFGKFRAWFTSDQPTERLTPAAQVFSSCLLAELPAQISAAWERSDVECVGFLEPLLDRLSVAEQSIKTAEQQLVEAKLSRDISAGVASTREKVACEVQKAEIIATFETWKANNIQKLKPQSKSSQLVYQLENGEV